MKPRLFLNTFADTLACAAIGALFVFAAIGAASANTPPKQPRYDVMSPNAGDDAACHDYVIGDIATGQEIAAMLEDAAKGARLYGCVNIVVDHGSAAQ